MRTLKDEARVFYFRGTLRVVVSRVLYEHKIIAQILNLLEEVIVNLTTKAYS